MNSKAKKKTEGTEKVTKTNTQACDNQEEFEEASRELNEIKDLKQDSELEKEAEIETDALQANSSDLEKKIEELNQQLLRTAADFDNFRKRSRLEKEQLVEYANSEFMKQLLPVLDSFELALKVEEPGEEVKKFLAGIEKVRKQFWEILEKAGLQEIPGLGEKFDPEKHEAVMQVADPEKEDNTIVGELRKGYKYKERIIRAGMVQVVINN